MKKNTRYEIDLANLPPLTEMQKEEIRALSEMKEGALDFSDSPLLDDNFWKKAIQNPFYKPAKTSTTVRVDADVLAWLKGQGKGYQTRINAILREAMIRALERKA